MKRVLTVFLAVAVASFAFGCKKGSDGSAEGKKYEIKAGSVTYSFPIPGMAPVVSTTYFDDYGAKECSESKSDFKIFGQSIKQHTRTITKDGYSYNLDMIKKTGTKAKIDDFFTADMKLGFAALAASMKDKMKIKELGTEDFLGKKCRKVQMSLDEGKSYSTFWLWNNISLKMEGEEPSTKRKYTFAASKVEELSNVPSEMFEIPSDFKITETKMPQMDGMDEGSEDEQ